MLRCMGDNSAGCKNAWWVGSARCASHIHIQQHLDVEVFPCTIYSELHHYQNKTDRRGKWTLNGSKRTRAILLLLEGWAQNKTGFQQNTQSVHFIITYYLYNALKCNWRSGTYIGQFFFIYCPFNLVQVSISESCPNSHFVKSLPISTAWWGRWVFFFNVPTLCFWSVTLNSFLLKFVLKVTS